MLTRSLAFAEQKQLVDSFSKLSAKLGHLGDTPLVVLQSWYCLFYCMYLYISTYSRIFLLLSHLSQVVQELSSFGITESKV